MKTFYTTRYLTALITLMGMLFVQMSAFACQDVHLSQSSQHVMMAMDDAEMADMPCCAHEKQAKALLCEAHCHPDGTLDKATITDVPELLAAQFYEIPVMASAYQDEPHHSFAPFTRTTAPPITIRHCCFRI
jgi:hypothetical protein